jgi:hypothetical protein
MAQSDGNLNVRTDGLRPSVQNKKNETDKHRQTNTQKTFRCITSEGIEISVRLNLKEFVSGDRWHNLMEIDTDGRTSSVEQNQNGQAQTGKHTKTSEEEVST